MEKQPQFTILKAVKFCKDPAPFIKAGRPVSLAPSMQDWLLFHYILMMDRLNWHLSRGGMAHV
jgi:hypothetical protein